VVDDDVAFRSGLAANLEDDGHAVASYADPRDVPAVALCGVHVVVTDYHMAEVDGLTFADAVHAAHPAVAVVLLTAYWTIEIEAAAAARPYLELRRKPIDYDALHAATHRLARAGAP
jgi:DNA-binding NtrC family response regulator